MTKQKQLVYEIVCNSHNHPTAEQIFALAKQNNSSIVLATVYNNLNALTKSGKIRKIAIANDPYRFESLNHPHEHLKCDKCGKIYDISIDGFIDYLTQSTGLKITSYELNMHYICDECRSKI